MGDAVTRGKVSRLRHTHAEGVDPAAPGSNQNRALLADQPGAPPTSLQSKPGALQQLTLAVVDQVGEQSERRRLRRSVAPR